MTTQDEDPTALIVQQAEALNRARMEAVRPLADVLARRKRLQDELAETDEEYGRAYAEAERYGWTSEDLKDMGAQAPTRRPRGRPAKRRTAKKSTPAQSSSETSSGGIQPSADMAGSNSAADSLL